MVMDSPLWGILWVSCGLGTVIAAVFATRRTSALHLGRVAVGVLFTIGGRFCTC